MKGKRLPRLRRFASRAWVAWQESSAIMIGAPIEVDGDVFKEGHRPPSPLITEVHKHTEVHAKGRTF